MSKRILLSLSEEKQEQLQSLKFDDKELSEADATFIARLISREYARREEEKSRRPPGRPRKESGSTPEEEEIDDDIANIPHPMAPGTKLTKQEYKNVIEFYKEKGVDIVKEAQSMQMEMKRD